MALRRRCGLGRVEAAGRNRPRACFTEMTVMHHTRETRKISGQGLEEEILQAGAVFVTVPLEFDADSW